MSQIPLTVSFPHNFQSIFNASLRVYEKKTKKDLLAHPLMAQFLTCNSPTDILAVLRSQVHQFEQASSGNDRLTRWLNPTVNVLYAFTAAVGAGVGMFFSPANVIFAGAGILLAAATDLAKQDALVEIFERIEGFFRRLETYTTVPTTDAMKDIIVKIMAEVLGIFAIVTKEIKLGLAKKYLRKLVGRTDIEDALRRLESLTLEEVRMATAEVLKATHRVENGVRAVGVDVRGVDVRVQEVDNRVKGVDDKVKGVDNKIGVAIKDGKETKALMQHTASHMEIARRNRVRRDHRAWLLPPDPSTNQNIAHSTQHEGTAMWLFRGSIIVEWKSKSATSLLWIHGKPGSGKSILCSAIIRDIIALREAGLASLAYFYFDFRDADKQNLHNALPSILTQLSARSDPCSEILSRVYAAHDDGSHKPSTSTMINCLKEMLALPGQAPVYIILDALDECPNSSGIPSARKQVLDLLKDLVSLQLPGLHLCVTSRPEIDIRVALEPLAFQSVSIHDQSGQKTDIEEYIRFVVYAESETAMGKWRKQDKELVIETLTERADGMFRWVFCQLEVLQHCFPQSIRQTLNELPNSLDETYERVLKEIGIANRKHAHRLLQCLAAAIRPMRVEELAEILALDFDGAEGATPKLNADWRWKDRQQAVLSTCSSLITVVNYGGSRVIQFTHFSVKEFLTSDRLASSQGDVSHFHITPEPAHTTLTQACLGILLQSHNRAEGGFPLARYASRHWVEHARFGTVSSRIEGGLRLLFDSTKPHFAAWHQLYDIDEHWIQFTGYKSAHSRSPLYYASLCGFRDLAAHIIAEHPEQVNAKGGLNHSPLVAALYKGHFDVADLLYQHGAAVDVTCYERRTPLQAASMDGLFDVARWLLDHGADANLQENDHRTPVYSAAAAGHLEVVRILLAHGVRVDAANDAGHTSLHRAANYGYVEIARLLLAHRADIAAENRHYSTPLHLAASNGRLEVMRLLLEHDADVEAENKDGRTPLHLASSSGGAEIVRLLLDHHADVNAENKDKWTPLHLASSEGHLKIMRLLLDRGANAGAKNVDGWAPLHLAWKMEVVELLLDRGADVDTKDKEGWTPLHEASYEGRTEIVRLLLARGASADSQDSEGRTPSQVASGKEKNEILQMLADHVPRTDRVLLAYST